MQIVSLLARSCEPMTVGQIVAAVPVGQSTVSAHLKQLTAVGFVIAEDRGTSRLYRINDEFVSPPNPQPDVGWWRVRAEFLTW